MSSIQPAGAPISVPMGNGGGAATFQQEVRRRPAPTPACSRPPCEQVEQIQDLLREFDAAIARISTLHSQGLQIMDPDGAQRHQATLDEQVGATRGLSTELKNRIAALKARPAAGPEARIQKNQTELVTKKFVGSLQNYQNVERDYRAKYRTRVERQFKLGTGLRMLGVSFSHPSSSETGCHR
jgi:t-SNARE complex subunit (syntaxin)